MKNKKLLIEIENTYSGKVHAEDRRFYSSKHGGQGIGTASVMQIAEKYGGYADFGTEDHIFRVNIFLPVGQPLELREGSGVRI